MLLVNYLLLKWKQSKGCVNNQQSFCYGLSFVICLDSVCDPAYDKKRGEENKRVRVWLIDALQILIEVIFSIKPDF